MRGPKVKVRQAVPVNCGTKWVCKLKCDHNVFRPMKRRDHGPGNGSLADPPPKWVYCEKCVEAITPEEWRNMVLMAHVMLVIDSCKQYCLISGGPKANINRCEEILEEGKKRRIRISDAEVRKTTTEFIREWNEQKGKKK